jgi:hypothetical protein
MQRGKQNETLQPQLNYGNNLNNRGCIFSDFQYYCIVLLSYSQGLSSANFSVMKKNSIALSAFCLLLSLSVKAQIVLGPYNIFVSRQGANNAATMSGSYPASADEGRVIRVRITDVQGPIIVTPTSYDLTGPPCPTYVNDVRTPATPAPAATTTFTGRISVDESNLPAAGTTATAQFKASETGYYTRCAQNVQVPFDSFGTVRFNIHSIRVTLANRTAEVCNDTRTTIRVAFVYPAGQGTVTWSSANGNITIVSSNNTEAVIQGAVNGDDFLIATLTTGNVSFKDTAKIKVNILKFKKPQKEVAWCRGCTFDATTLLTDSSARNNLQWAIRTISGPAATINANTGVVTYAGTPGGLYELTVSIRGVAPVCRAVGRLMTVGFSIVLIDRSRCDGEEARLEIRPVPATAPRASLREFGPITLESKTKVAFGGNPADREFLRFAAIDADFKSKVLNCYWYAIAGRCNTAAIHEIKGKATVQGVEVVSTTTPELTVNIGACVNGFTSATQTFTGAPTIATVPKQIMVRGRPVVIATTTVTGVGTLRRDPRGTVTMFRCPPNSQFFNYIRDEENYHVGQIEGRNGNLCADLWLVQNVMNQLNGRSFDGLNAAASIAVANQAILLAIRNENMRCNNMMTYPPANAKRCALETEAKANTRIRFGYHMPCAYPLCR